jgi:hypothetical protein
MELIGSGGPFAPGAVIEGDQMVETVTELLRHAAHPEYQTLMVSEAASLEYAGPEGFTEAWNDWLTPYESFRIEFDEVIREGSTLVFLVRQIATTKHSGVRVETVSASVWWFEDGMIRQAGFYLDQQAGIRAAGIRKSPGSS